VVEKKITVEVKSVEMAYKAIKAEDRYFAT